MNRLILASLCFSLTFKSFSQENKLNDGSWKEQHVELKNTPEAEIMIRVGDVDNLGYGFEEGFNPFCGTTTTGHGYPWEVKPEDPEGTDMIMVPSSFKDNSPCGGDGYSGSPRQSTIPKAIHMKTGSLSGIEIKNAALVMFVDDFQATQFCSKFQVTLNGKRFYDAEKVLNSLDQSGPVGKLVTIPISEDLFPELKKPELLLKVDDPTTAAADGYAIDFVKLVVNFKPQFTCIGSLTGFVQEEGSSTAIEGALVEVKGFGEAKTDAKGYFKIDKLPAGMQVASAGKEGYEMNSKAADVTQDGQEPITILLKPNKKTATYSGKQLRQGETVVMNNILFDQGKSDLKKEGMTELDKVVEFLKTNPDAQIELSGHTSSEGSRESNKSLSFRRVNSCRDYVASKGIGADRISISGHGPDRPIASNDTEDGRNKNRRVEMKILKL